MDIPPSRAVMLHPVLARQAHQEVMIRNPGLAAAADKKKLAQVQAYRQAIKFKNSIDILV